MTRTARPRGRPRKGSTRMDAALDAMRCYGFSDDLIFSTVKDLSEAYGDEGWPFIEDSSYKVLLEAILEKVENQEQEKSNAFQDNERHEKISRYWLEKKLRYQLPGAQMILLYYLAKIQKLYKLFHRLETFWRLYYQMVKPLSQHLERMEQMERNKIGPALYEKAN